MSTRSSRSSKNSSDTSNSSIPNRRMSLSGLSGSKARSLHTSSETSTPTSRAWNTGGFVPASTNKTAQEFVKSIVDDATITLPNMYEAFEAANDAEHYALWESIPEEPQTASKRDFARQFRRFREQAVKVMHKPTVANKNRLHNIVEDFASKEQTGPEVGDEMYGRPYLADLLSRAIKIRLHREHPPPTREQKSRKNAARRAQRQKRSDAARSIQWFYRRRLADPKGSWVQKHKGKPPS